MRSSLLVTAILALAIGLSACGPSTPEAPDSYDVECVPASLIIAIGKANNDAGPAILNLAADCIYKLNHIDNTQTVDGVAIRSGLPVISSKITIMGNHATILAAPADTAEDQRFGHFFVQPEGYLILHDLTLQEGIRIFGGAIYNHQGKVDAHTVSFVGNIAAGLTPNMPPKGGAIFNDAGSLKLLNGCQFDANAATSLFGTPGAIDSGSSGGAIFSRNGFLLISNTDFGNNHSADQGGAIGLLRVQGEQGYEGVLISGSRFEGNSAQFGGAIYAGWENTLFIIASSDFVSNLAVQRGGAIEIWQSILTVAGDTFTENEADDCGAIDNYFGSELEISSSTLQSNTATFSGGGICHAGKKLAIETSKMLSNQAGENGGGVFVSHGSTILTGESGGGASAARTFTIRQSTLDANTAGYDGNGGGVYTDNSMQISASTFSNNLADRGGGIYAGWKPDEESGAEINIGIVDSTFTGNGQPGVQERMMGGGIFFDGQQLDITSSTLDHNKSYAGGAVYGENGKVNLVNSTVSENEGAWGSSMYLAEDTETSILHSSLTDNASTHASHATFEVYGSLTIKNSIVAKYSYGLTCLFSGPGPFTMLGQNLDRDGTCPGFTIAAINQPGTYDYLADNGGLTWTNRLTNSSLARDAADDCSGLTEDQRGVTRPSGPACDLGAYEYEETPSIPPVPPMPEQPDITQTPSVTGGVCEYRPIRNVNCRASDDQESTLIAILIEGDLTKLVSLNPEFSHGLFETSGEKSCWIWLGLMDGPEDPFTSCKVPVNDPPPSEPSMPGCSTTLQKDQCEAAGGTWSGRVSSAPHCVCP